MSLVFMSIVVVVTAEQGVCADGFLWLGFGFMVRSFYVIAIVTKCYLATAAPDRFVGLWEGDSGKLIIGHAVSL